MSSEHDLYRPLYYAARFGLNRKFPRQVSGMENIPDTPSLYVPNHLRFIDSFIVAASYTEATDIPMRFGAKREYFDGDGIDNHGKLGRVMKWFVESTHQIPVEREGANLRAFFDLQEEVRACIERGDSVALHPEGTRSLDGRLYKFRSGAARIALALSVPVVPTGLIYQPRENSGKTDVRVIFGKPILPSEYDEPPYAGLAKAKKSSLLSEMLEERVAELTGQERAHVYANIHTK